MGITYGGIGAAGELIVSADLMHKGYDVFRNLSPNGPVDLVAMLDGRLWRVQVKVRSTAAGISDEDLKHCDVLAVVKRDDTIEYLGDFEGAKSLDSRAHRCKRQYYATSYDVQSNAMVHGLHRCTLMAKPGEQFCARHLEDKPLDNLSPHAYTHKDTKGIQ